MPSRPSPRRQQALKEQGALHPHAEKVSDPIFHDSAFFDPHDIVQVKYEMLRRVRTSATYVSDAADAFGFSRPAFYQARAAFERDGLPGLLPHKRGPHGPHKLTDEILTILDAKRGADGLGVPARELAAYLQTDFGIRVHPRTIERSLVRFRARREKKR